MLTIRSRRKWRAVGLVSNSVGAEASEATGVNGNQKNISARDAGAAYVFGGLGSENSNRPSTKHQATRRGLALVGKRSRIVIRLINASDQKLTVVAIQPASVSRSVSAMRMKT